MEIVVG